MKKLNLMTNQHVQLGGMAAIDNMNFIFSPDEPETGVVSRFRSNGIGQLLPDGTFDFVATPRKKSQSVLIRKLTHGRLSATQDGAIQLTLKFFRSEGIDMAEALSREALDAINALENGFVGK